MKTNVITSQFAIECYDSVLEIIGQYQGSAVLCLVGHLAMDLQRSLPEFCKNPILTSDISSNEFILIFEMNLGGRLRNPRKLLKSVRNKLMQVGFSNQVDAEMEFNALYEPTARQEHEMFQWCLQTGPGATTTF